MGGASQLKLLRVDSNKQTAFTSSFCHGNQDQSAKVFKPDTVIETVTESPVSKGEFIGREDITSSAFAGIIIFTSQIEVDYVLYYYFRESLAHELEHRYYGAPSASPGHAPAPG